MCGIAGVVNLVDRPPPDPRLLVRMTSALGHRGPDGKGIYRDAEAGLAHARLSIIDVEGGGQPLTNEIGSAWITFNGEVYNYVELRPELESRGHRFRTVSDTEVVLHAWEEWGDRCVERFNGQFAFAIWDRPTRTLFLARDRLGVRPLHWCEHDGRLWFASEAKALFAEPTLPRELDPEGLDQVFTFWTTVAPTTAFLGVHEMPPATTLTVGLASPGVPRRSERRYWTPAFPPAGSPFPLSLGDAASELRARLEKAARLRMLRSDVPVGSYLSGGLDSSVVAALGRRAKAGWFRTFSVRFADAEFDETPWQKEMVAHLDSDHDEVVCTRGDIAREFPSVVFHAERPLLRTAAAPLFILSRLVRSRGFKVVLTGEGADEVLGGYDLFREAKVRAFWARQPRSTIRPRLLERLYPYLARSPTASRAFAQRFFAAGLEHPDRPEFSHEPRWRSAAALKRLFSGEMLERVSAYDAVAKLVGGMPAESSSWEPLARAQYLEIVTLLSGHLLSSQGDRMAMAHSVEGRFPFLDPDVVDFCNSLPACYKLRVLDEKHVLKHAAKSLLPESILKRPKQPYRAPDAASFADPGEADWIEGVLDPVLLRAARIFDPPSVRRLAEKCRRRGESGPLSNADNMALVGVLSTQILWDRFVRRRPDPPEPHAAVPGIVIDRVAPP